MNFCSASLLVKKTFGAKRESVQATMGPKLGLGDKRPKLCAHDIRKKVVVMQGLLPLLLLCTTATWYTCVCQGIFQIAPFFRLNNVPLKWRNKRRQCTRSCVEYTRTSMSTYYIAGVAVTSCVHAAAARQHLFPLPMKTRLQKIPTIH